MEQKEDNIILIHACCGICSGYPIGFLKEMGYEPVVYFCNPNLDTKEEYERRLEAQKIVCMYHWVDLIVEEYRHEDFLSEVKGLENEPERGSRCLKCFKLRLLKTAQYARDHGFTVITTTLASSRWKSLEQIEEAGRFAESQVPEVTFWAQNWRKGGLSERRIQIIKDYGFYNQQYCGCEFSMR